MSTKILRLPESVINQIAAGEVVENPASIVKELVENSLDAGAERIAVEIIQGGQQLIRVEDDGCGMGPEDAVLCLERHATSKIQKVEDLQKLSTMGFRGEALAAISAVSCFELRTALAGEVGTRVAVEGGRQGLVQPCARNRGTTIEVRSLFFNVPARKKFQKSVGANTAQVTKMIETLSMAHPQVAFSLTHKGESLFEVRPGEKKERVEQIGGQYELSFQLEKEGIKVEGYAAAPAKAMSTRTGQQVFLNRRPIFSPLIARAVKESFGTRIGEHAYPPFVLFLEVSPEIVDVNVHPQKREVRFSDEGAIFRFIQEAVNKAFTPAVCFSAPVAFTSPASFSLQEAPVPFMIQDAPQEFDLVYADRPLVVMGSYLLLQQGALILVDLQAAHARVLFENLKEKQGETQALIWPLEIDLKREEETAAEALHSLGVECRILPKKLIIDGLPSFLEASHFPLFWEQWKEKKKLDQCTFSFCRKVKKEYGMEEAIHLWRRLQKCQDRLFDPLGNRIWSEVKEEHFERILK